MINPNTAAIKGSVHDHNLFDATIECGMFPVAAVQSWPTIIYRWGMKRVFAPTPKRLTLERQRPLSTEWIEGVWIEAWVYGLLYMRRATDVFTNAWTSVQENKPRVLELKMLYDEAVVNPEQKIVILTEFLFFERWSQDAKLPAAARANLKEIQYSLKEGMGP